MLSTFRPWPLLAPPLALAALILGLVLAANLLAGQLLGGGYRLAIGTRPDRALVEGFHGGERDSNAVTYRWTDGAGTLTLRGPATRGPVTLAISLGWLPPGGGVERRIYTTVDGRRWVQISHPSQPRRYAMLLPPGALADGEVQIGLASASNVVPPDERPLGVRVDAVALGWPGTSWPLAAPLVLGAQAGLAAAWLFTARRLGLGMVAALAVALAMVVALAVRAAQEPTLAAPWQARLLGAGIVAGALVLGAQALAPRVAPGASASFVRALLLITLAALAVRLLGILYPTFLSHDYLVNSGRLRNVQLGDLTLFDRPSEFSRRVAVVSPTVFILAAPLTLLGDQALALQGLYTVLDGTTPLLVALLARRLGLSERAALLAAGLIALLPMHLTALYWGFVKQIVGQWLALLLLVVAAGPPPRRALGWAAAGVLAVVALLIHPGGLLLAGICLGIFVVAGLAIGLRAERARQPAAAWGALFMGEALAGYRGWLITLAGGVALMLALQYAEAIRLMLGGLLDGSTATPDSTNQTTDAAARMAQIWVGLRASFAPLPLALVGAGLAALLWRTRGPARLLAAGWTLSALLFLAVDIATGQQVRYGYFIAPLACAGVAALLEPLLGRRLGQAAAWALVALVLVAGLSLWLGAALAGVKPSVNPLTH